MTAPAITHRNDQPALSNIETFDYLGFTCLIGRDRETRDWAMEIDGQPVGSARTKDEGCATLRTSCEETARHTRATTADMAADAAERAEEAAAEATVTAVQINEPGLRKATIPVTATSTAEIVLYTPRNSRGHTYYALFLDGRFYYRLIEWKRAAGQPGIMGALDRALAQVHEAIAALNTPPTRDDLAAALDRANTARIATERDTPEWYEAQAMVDRAHEALDPVGYRAARAAKKSPKPWHRAAWREDWHQRHPATPDTPPYALLADPVEESGTPALGACEGYDWGTCPNPATHTLTVDIALNSQASIFPDLIRVCDACAAKWAPRVIPAGKCYACKGKHDIQQCPKVRVALLSEDEREREMRDGLDAKHAADEANLDRALYDKGAGTGGDPTLIVAVQVDDPCANVRRALRNLLAALEDGDRMSDIGHSFDTHQCIALASLFNTEFAAELEAARAALRD